MIKVSAFHLVHSNGTKDYHIFVVGPTLANAHFVINRWGKVNTTGQYKTILKPNDYAALDEAQKTIRQKVSRGYSINYDKVKDYSFSKNRRLKDFLFEIHPSIACALNDDEIRALSSNVSSSIKNEKPETLINLESLPDHFGAW